MPSWMSDRLKEIAVLHNKEKNSPKCQTALPFMLVGRSGAPFTVLGFSRGCFFTSRFFTVISIDEESRCAVLEVLAPCGCGHNLFRTKARIVVNTNRFCGIELVELPVYDYLQRSSMTKDQLCLPFLLTKKDSPKTICTIERKEVQHTETIGVHYTGADAKVELALYTQEKSIRLQVPKNEFRSITVFNLQSIEIFTPINEVKGTVEIQLNFCEKKNIYY